MHLMPMQNNLEINQVMRNYNKKFRNILPNKYDFHLDCKALLFPFEKEQIIELIEQFDLCMQLIV